MDKVYIVNGTHTPDYYPETVMISIHKSKEGAEAKMKQLEDDVDPHNHIPMHFTVEEEDLLN